MFYTENFNTLLQYLQAKSFVKRYRLKTKAEYHFNTIEWKDNGFMFSIWMPKDVDPNLILDDKPMIESTFRSDIKMEYDKYKGLMYITVYDKIGEIMYKKVPTSGNKLLVGHESGAPILIDMDLYANLLICGLPGMGKSKQLQQIVTNLLLNKNAILQIVQYEKYDLEIFKNCILTQFYNSLNEILAMLQFENKIIDERLKVVKSKTIKEYNKLNNKPMMYHYVIFDEFAYIMPKKTETKEIQEIKQKILDQIEKIIMRGRSTGIFIVIALQRPEEKALPPNYKAMFNNRISFKTANEDNSRMVIDIKDAAELKQREFIIINSEPKKLKTYNINDSNIELLLSDYKRI